MKLLEVPHLYLGDRLSSAANSALDIGQSTLRVGGVYLGLAAAAGGGGASVALADSIASKASIPGTVNEFIVPQPHVVVGTPEPGCAPDGRPFHTKITDTVIAGGKTSTTLPYTERHRLRFSNTTGSGKVKASLIMPGASFKEAISLNVDHCQQGQEIDLDFLENRSAGNHRPATIVRHGETVEVVQEASGSKATLLKKIRSAVLIRKHKGTTSASTGSATFPAGSLS